MIDCCASFTEYNTQMITFTFENGAVCTLRGSGTEPKLKFYVEAKGATREEMQDTLSSVTTAVSRLQSC